MPAVIQKGRRTLVLTPANSGYTYPLRSPIRPRIESSSCHIKRGVKGLRTPPTPRRCSKHHTGLLATGGPSLFCSFAASPGPCPTSFLIMGSSPNVSFALFCSIYSCAFALNGNAGRPVGSTAPFWTSSSAIGKAVTLGAVWGFIDIEVARTLRDGEAPAGAAGSAAARARKMQWVFRERSAALGFARRARA